MPGGVRSAPVLGRSNVRLCLSTEFALEPVPIGDLLRPRTGALRSFKIRAAGHKPRFFLAGLT